MPAAAHARIAPRLMNRQQAARYCAHDSLEEFDRWARKVGLRTVPGRQGAVYDQRQIDQALDALMGLDTNPTTTATREADAYFAGRDGR